MGFWVDTTLALCPTFYLLPNTGSRLLFAGHSPTLQCVFLRSLCFRIKMSRKVYIGRLNDQVRERDVDHFFRGFHVRDIMLKNGYGFVVSVTTA